jgi:host factor-I protein
MENKPAQNIQDTFLNTARKYSVVLETNNQEQLIFKHAISTVAMGRTLHGPGERPTVLPAPTATPSVSPEAVSMPRPSGTEG